MADLNTYRRTDAVDDVMAVDLNRPIDSTIRGLFTNTETLSANKTLVDADFPSQYLTISAARDCTLPAVSTSNHIFYIYNAAAATYNLTVKNSGGTTIQILYPSTGAFFVSNGVIWTQAGGFDADIYAIAQLVSAADTLPYFTGAGAAALASFVAGGRALVALAGVANRVPYYTAVGVVTTIKSWLPIAKTSDENVTSSTTLINDALLRVTLAANTKYAIRGRIYFTTGATPDFKYRFSYPTTPTLVSTVYSHIVPGAPTAKVTNSEVVTPTTTTAVVGAGTTGGYVEFDAIIQNVNSGTFAFQWAQNTSDPVAATVLAGSYFEYMVID